MKCIRCGECCRQLNWGERLKISWHTKRFMFTKTCYFLFENHCIIQLDKPKVCKDFHCGIQFIKQ
ncbi:unnamed protein product [marine sediment metagenome]|uniref:Uncharacterized protein n=1 Tax=marine sediment metagenome TaxID=412755 RepID=X0WEN5_9ZZZZ